MEAQSDKIKYDFICSLLAEGDAMITLDARKEGVSVPPEHRKNHSLSLILNLNFKRHIELNDTGIFATLLFGGRPYNCVVPMHAVWAACDPHTEKRNMWIGSIPSEAIKKMAPAMGALESDSPASSKPTPPSNLRVVSPPHPASNSHTTADDKKSVHRGTKRKGHLRVIK